MNYKKHFIIKYRWWIIGASLLITLVFALQIPRARIDPNLDHYIPKTMQSRVNTEKIEEIFGGNDMLMVVLGTKDVLADSTLRRLKKISGGINHVRGIGKVLSLFDSKDIRSEQGAMIVDPAIKKIPRTKKEREQLRETLKNNELVYKTVVSRDFDLAGIIMILNENTDQDSVMTEVNNILKNNPGPEQVYFGGLPYMNNIISGELSRDMMLLMPAGLLIMLVMLYFFFKQKRGVILPFAVVIMAILFSMGIMPLVGWKMSVITLLLPIILIAVGNDYGIHLVARYQEMVKAKGDKAHPEYLSVSIFNSLKKPIFLAGITTLAGILSLLSHRMIPARQLGILAGAGIVFALALSLFFIPAILSLLKQTTIRKNILNNGKDRLGQFLVRLGQFVTNKPKQILAVSLMFTVVIGLGLLFLKVDTNIERFFPKHHPVREGAEIINKNFGGTQSIAILVEGDIKDPELLKKMDHYEMVLKSIPGVGSVASITDVVKEISKAMNDKRDPWYDTIPGSRNAVAQYFELYSMSGDPDDFDQLVDFDYQHAQILVTLNNVSNQSVKKVIKKAKEITKGDPDVKLVGGYAYVTSELADLVVKGQLISLIVAIFVIGLLVVLIFRSPAAGLISTIPLSLAVVILFGLMGWLGIRLDIATALLSSMMIGIGVDYTIHFLWRFREEKQKGLNSRSAIRKTLRTTGRGILFNALSVIIGFSVLLISSFPPIRFFGFLVIISITACLAGAFIIIPSILMIREPFQSRKGPKIKSFPGRELVQKIKSIGAHKKLKPALIHTKHNAVKVKND